MAKSITKLREDRAKAWESYQELRANADRESDTSAEALQTQERALADVEALSRSIEVEERAEAAERSMNAAAPGQDLGLGEGRGANAGQEDERYQRAFDAYLRRGLSGVASEDREVFQQGFEERAQSTGVDAEGGYTVPDEFRVKMTEALKTFGGILSVAEVLNSTNGRDISWPTNDDTSNKGEIISENAQHNEQDVVFGTVSVKAHTYSSKMVKVPVQLLQDGAFNLNIWLPKKLGERIGRASADHFATGSGVGQPQGLVTGLDAGATSDAIDYDTLIDLEHSIDQAYRQNGRYVASDGAVKAIRKLKDLEGRPMWAPSLVAGAPDLINGKPYTVDNGLGGVTDGASPLVFGDIKEAYIVRLVSGGQVLRLTERYAERLQVAFLGFQRIDGKVQNKAAAKKLTLDLDS